MQKPYLPAQILVERCYENMFDGCTYISYMNTAATDISAYNCTYNWLKDVAPTGDFYGETPDWEIDDPSGIPLGWTPHLSPYIRISPASQSFSPTGEQITFTIKSNIAWTVSVDNTHFTLDTTSGTGDGTIKVTAPANTGTTTISATLSVVGSEKTATATLTQKDASSCKYIVLSSTGETKLDAWGGDWRYRNIDYSYDDITWTRWDWSQWPQLSFGTTEHPKIFLRGDNPCITITYSQECSFKFTGTTPIYCSGNIMHLLSYTEDLTELPHTYSCFAGLFKDAVNLVTAPSFPATSLHNAAYCYYETFSGCTSLISAPELPSTVAPLGCYNSMFAGCTSLVNAPELPATTLDNGCYANMFSGCTSLVSAPAILPAKTLSHSCYGYMFDNCKALVNAPELPAISLIYGCYQGMFRGCTSLTTAPTLLPTHLEQRCYSNMFEGCSSLNYIKCFAVDLTPDYALSSWVSGVAPTGTFVKNTLTTTWTTGTQGIPTGWTTESEDNHVYLKFTADAETRITISTSGWYNKNVQYSEDGISWYKWEHGNSKVIGTETLPSIYMRGNNPNGLGPDCNITFIHYAGNVECVGDVMYLLSYTEKITKIPNNECFKNLFSTKIISYGKDGLISAPKLSATELTDGCYENMFDGCALLTTAPELNVKTLKPNCYKNMFIDCSSLNNIKCLATDISATDCTSGWTNGVASTGTFTKDASMNDWSTGTDGVPSGWVVQDE